MERFITHQLVQWKNQERRKPLILRGARQVGKTWAVIDFGRNHFNGHIHVVDLEQHLDWHQIFEKDLVTSRILSELEVFLNARIIPHRDLLFIDEIQSCPRAVMALRYFYEEHPELHVIAAGSLLEFAAKEVPFPVGRVQILNMYPMSYSEYLKAIGKNMAAEIVMSSPSHQPESIHDLLLDELRRYMFIGGMPECVQEYINSGKMRNAFDVQANLINTYRQDFSKYAPYSDKRCMNAVLSSVARNVGKQIKYNRLADSFTNPTIKRAFDLLYLAKLVQKVPSTNPGGLPLGAASSDRRFKALIVDIGLMQSLCGVPVDIEYQKADLLSIYQGAMAEQFVGQEFLASGQDELYYWSREAKSSTAEVDFLITVKGRVYPVEIKSGASGRLRSLHMLLKTYPNCPSGYVFSCAPYSELPEQRLVFLPLYYAYSIGSSSS